MSLKKQKTQVARNIAYNMVFFEEKYAIGPNKCVSITQ